MAYDDCQDCHHPRLEHAIDDTGRQFCSVFVRADEGRLYCRCRRYAAPEPIVIPERADDATADELPSPGKGQRLVTPAQLAAGYLRRAPDGTVRHCAFRLICTRADGNHVVVEPDDRDDPRGYDC